MRYITPFILIFILITVFTSAGANTTENTTAENVTITNTTNSSQDEVSEGKVSLEISPPYLNLGTVQPDGIERSYYNSTTLRASQRGQLRLSVYSESDSLMSTDNQEIPVSNLKYSINYNSPYGPIVVAKRSFTTTPYLFWQRNGNTEVEIPINYHITVPPFTDPGTYSIRIMYQAI
ncbi:hypothetical protein [Methanothermobacter wolfeii]|uniref:hypothetical protein n=1 Tax=Methanothermobacter wolfeii TaxID=145261 RepID=UPI0024B331D5|nr:hypothetical protein [Methanothermobacter wolfeii]MDI6701398.1 hypothetical protein [Methanothermobacter wolfeii]MDI6842057.1 hypothetical protein [Methanothermobacter wolfeii]